MTVTISSAAGVSLEALADLFTRAFEGYFYPGITSTHTLARRVASENIDLLRSLVLRVDDTPAGIALLARRGERAWCGGFGITAAHRGKGHAHTLAAALLREAHEAGADSLSLEVLTRNSAALRVYERAGLAIIRRLLILAWRPADDPPPAEPAPVLEEVDPTQLILSHFAAFHPRPAAWQREPATLLAQPELRGLALRDETQIVAYALVQGEDSLRIHDAAAAHEQAAARLIVGLQASATSLTSLNEPADSPLTAAFLRAGFVVADEQHELRIAL